MSIVAAALSRDTPARTLPAGKPLPSRTRRVRVEKEHTPLALMAAIPEGYRPPEHVMEWVRAAREWLSSLDLRADARRNRLRVIEYLASRHQPRTRTILTTWAWIQDALGVARCTAARLLHELREAGLLTTVATGRSAARTPKATGRTRNEAPVYALMLACDPQPATSATDPQEDATELVEGVDINETPDPVGGLRSTTHARARELSPERSRYAADSLKWQHASRAAFATLAAQRPRDQWSRHATMPLTRLWSRRERKQALWELALHVQWFSVAMRGASTAAVAAAIRPFMLAGWNVGDVLHALEWSSDGQKDELGDLFCLRMDTYMRKRLASWMREGQPVASFSQRQEHEHTQRRARAQAEAERREEYLATATAAPSWFQKWRANRSAGNAVTR